jgi:Ribbon-helix-helix protein, copG family
VIRPESPTSGGVPVTDELVVQLAAEAEAGFDVETLRRRGGRRPLGTAAAGVVPVRLDPQLRDALQARAEAEQTTASDVIRQALSAWLDRAA